MDPLSNPLDFFAEGCLKDVRNYREFCCFLGGGGFQWESFFSNSSSEKPERKC